MLKVLDISGYDEIAIIGNRTGNLQVVFKIFSGETDGFINTACIHWENLKGLDILFQDMSDFCWRDYFSYNICDIGNR